MGKRGFLRSLLLASCLGVFGAGANAAPFTINDALRMAVQTNPSVGEAAANKRATEAELRQVQSTLLPQVRLEASTGPERLNNPATMPLNSITPHLTPVSTLPARRARSSSVNCCSMASRHCTRSGATRRASTLPLRARMSAPS